MFVYLAGFFLMPLRYFRYFFSTLCSSAQQKLTGQFAECNARRTYCKWFLNKFSGDHMITKMISCCTNDDRHTCYRCIDFLSLDFICTCSIAKMRYKDFKRIKTDEEEKKSKYVVGTYGVIYTKNYNLFRFFIFFYIALVWYVYIPSWIFFVK